MMTNITGVLIITLVTNVLGGMDSDAWDDVLCEYPEAAEMLEKVDPGHPFASSIQRHTAGEPPADVYLVVETRAVRFKLRGRRGEIEERSLRTLFTRNRRGGRRAGASRASRR